MVALLSSHFASPHSVQEEKIQVDSHFVHSIHLLGLSRRLLRTREQQVLLITLIKGVFRCWGMSLQASVASIPHLLEGCPRGTEDISWPWLDSDSCCIAPLLHVVSVHPWESALCNEGTA